MPRRPKELLHKLKVVSPHELTLGRQDFCMWRNTLATRSGHNIFRIWQLHTQGSADSPGARFFMEECHLISNTSFPIWNSFRTIFAKHTRARRAAILSFSSIRYCSLAFLSRIASSIIRLRAVPKASLSYSACFLLVFLTMP